MRNKQSKRKHIAFAIYLLARTYSFIPASFLWPCISLCLHLQYHQIVLATFQVSSTFNAHEQIFPQNLTLVHKDFQREKEIKKKYAKETKQNTATKLTQKNPLTLFTSHFIFHSNHLFHPSVHFDTAQGSQPASQLVSQEGNEPASQNGYMPVCLFVCLSVSPPVFALFLLFSLIQLQNFLFLVGGSFYFL